MSLEPLKSARKKTVGAKQTLKAVEKLQAKQVYWAADAEARVVDPILRICSTKNIPTVKVDSMKDLGRACGIDVGCAIASITEF
ncbi:ribosomal L7Ae/L30e/S12e/Gadd45 family protein [Desulforamulus hydrothermalis]|uniref:Putative ribosomal protein L7Ae-like n=1 Tax=Desulforamulus hydrothermalis Lam5 = DSM 18033 TaxID=1121428 RepID=K8E8G0_9FIRM|nr:ribosomal L7Ae/L30e/S12e/Gadd45 family protein [Desulforamulus hydrothermalis]CCO07793.1 putative ribosomal protein L7Ae-like [Desulforamulus hydrothermalis Lam5 = DSM 18033]SHH42985.1 large subunit ribosomal protein L7A [Desulforamulus hydrothermalis Lam5 = DSM 18033]